MTASKNVMQVTILGDETAVQRAQRCI